MRAEGGLVLAVLKGYCGTYLLGVIRGFPQIAGPLVGSSHEGSCHFRSLLSGPDFGISIVHEIYGSILLDHLVI